ncbi:MAG: ribbon-helix-helix domain-containing protein [Candidatus Helarchaeota archaeon]
MTTIPVPLNDDDLKKIDYLVKIGRYKNRTQAIKALLRKQLAQQTIILKGGKTIDEKSIKNIINELSKLPDFSFTIKSSKSAVELVGEERERY